MENGGLSGDIIARRLNCGEALKLDVLLLVGNY